MVQKHHSCGLRNRVYSWPPWRPHLSPHTRRGEVSQSTYSVRFPTGGDRCEALTVNRFLFGALCRHGVCPGRFFGGICRHMGGNCNLNNLPGFMQVHVVHVYTPGATACQFRLQHIGTPLTWIGDTIPPPFFAIGTSQSGIAIGYTACYASPIHVLTVMYMGVSAPCDLIRVVADPTATPPGIYVYDCSIPAIILTATGGAARINPNGTCQCTVPVEETTWGQVKALYQ